jgi:hypothetical protein
MNTTLESKKHEQMDDSGHLIVGKDEAQWWQTALFAASQDLWNLDEGILVTQVCLLRGEGFKTMWCPQCEWSPRTVAFMS